MAGTTPPELPSGAGFTDKDGRPVQMNRAMRNWLVQLQKWFQEKLDLLQGGTVGHLVAVASGFAVESSGKAPPTGTIVGDTDNQSLSNKALIEPVIAIIHYDAAKTKPITVPEPDGATEAMALTDSAQTLLLKTLTEPVIGTIHHSAVKTKPITVPEPDGATESFVLMDSAQTMTKKNVVLWQATHDYAAGVADWTLSATENTQSWLLATNASGAVNAIATPTLGKVFTVTNSTGFALTIKANAGTGVTIANGKTADVIGNGTDFIRKTPDA